MSGPLPGTAQDVRAARIYGILRELAADGLITLADKGYPGVGEIVLSPYWGKGKPPSPEQANRGPREARSASAPTPSSKPGASCADSAAAHGASASLPRPFRFCRSARKNQSKNFR